MRAPKALWPLFLVALVGCADYELVQREIEIPAGDTTYDVLGLGKKKKVTQVIKVDTRTGKTWVLRGNTWQPQFRERTWQEWWESFGPAK